MKKIITILLMIVLMFSFKINVLAENEGETGGSGTDTTDPSGDEGGEGETPTEDDKDKAILKDIKVNGKNIVCNGFTCEHVITDNDVKTVKITYKASDDATVDPSEINEKIEEGTTEFPKVTVTSKDGKIQNKYTFKITKKSLSTDSELKKLAVNGTEITLSKDKNVYQTNVAFGVKKLEIEAIPNDDKAKVLEFNNNKASFDFFENSKEIKIKVQSEAGDMTTYKLTVTRRNAADATLKSLTIKGHKLDFSSDIMEYELKVLKNVSKLEIEAKATDSKANVKITNPKLEIGDNTVKIEVSNDGNTSTYTIKVKKLDEDDKTLANLKSLTIQDYDIDFKPSKYEYDLHIKDENFLKIKSEAKLEESEVEITGNLDLENGSIIKIRLTYDNGINNVYKINILKDGNKANVTKKVSKKAALLVIGFDIISMIILGIVKIKDKINRNKNEETNRPVIKSRVKRNNIIENIDDVDII